MSVNNAHMYPAFAFSLSNMHMHPVGPCTKVKDGLNETKGLQGEREPGKLRFSEGFFLIDRIQRMLLAT